jgi:hypothetical protein
MYTLTGKPGRNISRVFFARTRSMLGILQLQKDNKANTTNHGDTQ